jgi:hypothetical protein
MHFSYKEESVMYWEKIIFHSENYMEHSMFWNIKAGGTLE